MKRKIMPVLVLVGYLVATSSAWAGFLFWTESHVSEKNVPKVVMDEFRARANGAKLYGFSAENEFLGGMTYRAHFERGGVVKEVRVVTYQDGAVRRTEVEEEHHHHHHHDDED